MQTVLSFWLLVCFYSLLSHNSMSNVFSSTVTSIDPVRLVEGDVTGDTNNPKLSLRLSDLDQLCVHERARCCVQICLKLGDSGGVGKKCLCRDLLFGFVHPTCCLNSIAGQSAVSWYPWRSYGILWATPLQEPLAPVDLGHGAFAFIELRD